MRVVMKACKEVKEGYNVAIADLVSPLFSLDWSEDNILSLITERVVHTFEMHPNPTNSTATAQFKRSMIYATDYLPCEVFRPIIDKLLLNCKKEDMYSFLFEEALTPKLNDRTEITPRIIQLAWSPAGLCQDHRCLLATVTSAGAVDLAFSVERDWYSVCNLSSVWWDIIEPEIEFAIDETQVSKISANTFRNNARRLVCVAVTWSHMLEDENSQKFSYLVTAYRSSDIAVWKVPKIPTLSYKLTPELVYTENSGDFGKITKLLLIVLEPKKYLILLGFFDGRILGTIYNEVGGKFEQESSWKYESPDGMPITYLQAKSMPDKENMVIFTKNSVVGVFYVDSDGTRRDKIYTKLPAYSISGVAILKNGDALVETQDNKFFHIKLEDNTAEKFSVAQEMKTTKTQTLGLTMSPSGVTFVYVTSPSTAYDHLINREPSILHFFTLGLPECNPWVNLETSSSNLMKYWDCLEMIRILATKAMDPKTILPKIPQQLDDITSVHQLRIIMWLTLITEIVTKKIVVKNIHNIAGEFSEAQPLIFMHSISAHLIRLSQKEQLDDEHRLSIHFLRIYLEVFLAGEDDADNSTNPIVVHAKQAINATSNIELIQVENCNFCGEVVTDLPWKTKNSTKISYCPKGHFLSRCALTFLQITPGKSRNCPVCSRMFHISSADEYGVVRCLYCDVVAEVDPRLRGVYDGIETACKNLTLTPAWEVTVSRKEDGDDEGVKDDRSKKRKVAKDGQ